MQTRRTQERLRHIFPLSQQKVLCLELSFYWQKEKNRIKRVLLEKWKKVCHIRLMLGVGTVARNTIPDKATSNVRRLLVTEE